MMHGGSIFVTHGGSMNVTHGCDTGGYHGCDAGGTYPISHRSVLPSPVMHTDLSAAQLGMIWKHVTENPPGIVSGSM